MWLPKQEYDLVEGAATTPKLSFFFVASLAVLVDRPGNTKRDRQHQPNYRVGHLIYRATVRRNACQKQLGCMN